MSAQTHPRLVGAFVLGAIALVLAAVVLLSSGAWLEATRTLAQLAETLAVMRNLAEYIETHPEAVIIGKPKGEERK